MDLDTVFSPNTVAVITGAAQGIGRAACLHAASRGASVCAVDLPGDRLDKTVEELIGISPRGEDAILSTPLDVSDPAQISQMRQTLLEQFGKVSFLFNNAVTRIGHGHGAEISEWRQAMDTNFWGCVYLVQAFLPAMKSTEDPSVIVNVGSKQGITNPPAHTIYNVTKSALKTYTEALEHEIRSEPESQISAHLLIPGWTSENEENVKKGAWRPDQVIDHMCAGLEKDLFYILCPDNEVSIEMDHKRIAWGAGDIIEGRPPLSRWHPDWKEKASKACT
ncbi:MAG: SDR family NAD(P)-dependent oxidoreductase [Proteobacteria bacterium]|nr:SDR family NAD(P)-dependent oxidoreductase [Pseudomonadota bacterium]